jgi:hypothetical protein
MRKQNSKKSGREITELPDGRLAYSYWQADALISVIPMRVKKVNGILLGIDGDLSFPKPSGQPSFASYSRCQYATDSVHCPILESLYDRTDSFH